VRVAQAWADHVPPSPKPPPDLVPIFGSQLGWSPGRTCADVHPNGPIPPGSRLVCMACHCSGVERQVARHTKPRDGHLREGWAKPTPTRYAPDNPVGQGARPAPKGKTPLKGGHR
jgi:hypothetical protein